MPIHPDFRSLYNSLVKQYGKKKGEQVFYAYCKKRGLDYTKPRKGQKPESKAAGKPKTDAERAKAHFKISDEKWDKLSDEEKQAYIKKLPPRGQKVKEFNINEFLDEYDEIIVEEKAVWHPTKEWPDSCFMWVPAEAKGKKGKKSLRKLPYKYPSGQISLPHVRNALARLGKTQGIPADAKARIKNRLQAILKRSRSEYKPSKAFLLDGDPIEISDKQFYGATIPIINVEIKDVAGEKQHFFEAFLTAPVKDLHGETISSKVMEEWSKECVAPPHNLGWLFHESPYKKPENKANPAIYRILESKIGELKDRLGKLHKGLWIKALLNKTHPRFTEIWNGIKTGFINSVSAEFIPMMVDPIRKMVTNAKYLASCLVMAPANDLATITAAYAKSFMGTRIEMSVPTNQSAMQPPAVPPQEGDSVEVLLRERDRAAAQQIGPQVPGVLPTITPIAPPAGSQTGSMPVTPTPPPATPPPAQPQPTPTEQKIDQILNKFTNVEQRITDMESCLNIVAPPEPEPTPEEVKRVLKYLAEQENLLKPVEAKPASQAKGSGEGKPSTASFSEKTFSQDEVDIMVRQAVRDAQVVRKGITENVVEPINSEFNVLETLTVDEHNIEGMLKKRDKVFRNAPLGQPIYVN